MCNRNTAVLAAALTALLCFSCSPGADEAVPSVSRSEISGVIEFLSSDLLEGRAPGTRGAELAEEYVKSVYELLGLEPYGGSYFQEFELQGYALEDLSVGAKGIELRLGADVVGSYVREEASFSLEGDAVFAGYGIVSDAWSWDDYKDVPVDGKILIVRVNEPGRGGTAPAAEAADDSTLFEGPALTYYGRWTYKIEEAARRGARGILLVHTDETAGYGWQVVRNSWSGEELYLPLSLENDLAFRGWIREERLGEVLDAAGVSLDGLYRRSESRAFEPVDLGFKVKVKGRNAFRSLETRNVVGYIPGGDPQPSKKAVVLSAHIDHLGMNESLEGDRIFNGAIDNASPVAAMIASARVLAGHRKDLAYSVIVLACQAEEAGLLGSRYFAENIEPADVVCNINFESTPVWGRTRDVMAIGAKYSTLEDILKGILKERGLAYSYFSMSEQGFFYRSDQFSFARRGIPALWISAGEDYLSGVNHLRDFFLGGAYHTVDDEFDPAWQLESTIQTVEAAVQLVEYINRHRPVIEWKGKLTFPVDE